MSTLKPPVSDTDQQTGNLHAGITLVEYGDYQCPHCGHAHPLLKRLIKEHGRSFRFVFRNFPLQESHPAAFIAALAAEAAARQGKFWEMHDIIFENQEDLHGSSFTQFAETLGLDSKTFARDWESKDLVAKVEADFESGIRSGVNGTPSFFLNGKKLNSYDGTYESLAEAISLPVQGH
ncbi:MAG: thioredoxin domain-containing protein [Puia sp.]|nr:thioredoxin domain-containing protein [Puia sp.]